jgi:hypothetical protein
MRLLFTLQTPFLVFWTRVSYTVAQVFKGGRGCDIFQSCMHQRLMELSDLSLCLLSFGASYVEQPAASLHHASA